MRHFGLTYVRLFIGDRISRFWIGSFAVMTVLMLLFAPPPLVRIIEASQTSCTDPSSSCEGPCCGETCCEAGQVCCNGTCCTGTCEVDGSTSVCCPSGTTLCGGVCCDTVCCNDTCGYECDSDGDSTPDECKSCPDGEGGAMTCKTCDDNLDGIPEACMTCGTGEEKACKVCDSDDDGVKDTCEFLCDHDKDGTKEACFECNHNPTVNTFNDHCFLCDEDGDGTLDTCSPSGQCCTVYKFVDTDDNGVLDTWRDCTVPYDPATQCCCVEAKYLVTNKKCP